MTGCADCGVTVVDETGDVENYMVHADIWAEAGMDYRGGFLCLNCLEDRLGREVTGADLPLDIPINRPGMQRDTPRLLRLKSEAWASAGSYVPPWMAQQQAVLTKLLAMVATREAS